MSRGPAAITRIAAVAVTMATKYKPPAKLCVVSRSQPTAIGPITPPRLPTELMSAIPAAAPLRLRNIDGKDQNVGREASMKNAISEAGSSTHQLEPTHPTPATPTAAIKRTAPHKSRFSDERSQNQPAVSIPATPTAAGIAVTKPVANTERPIPLMICGRKYATL